MNFFYDQRNPENGTRTPEARLLVYAVASAVACFTEQITRIALYL